MSDRPARPSQVTLSAWIVIGGSVLVLLLAFDQVAGLTSIEAQEQAAQAISEPPISELGLGVSDVIDVLRVLAIVGAAAAAAAAILGWEVLKGSKAARVALACLAPVMLLAGFTSAGFAAVLVAAGSVMLWTQPARAWFDGRTPSAAHPAGGVRRPDAAPPASPAPPLPSLPPPAPFVAPSTAPNPYHPHPHRSALTAPDSDARPGTVTAAGLTALIVSVLVGLAMLLFLVVSLTMRAEITRVVEDSGAAADLPESYPIEDAVALLPGVCGVLLAWCVLAVVLAVLTLRRSNPARIALIVSAAAAAALSLPVALYVLPLVVTASAIVTVVLLAQGPAVAWFAAGRRRSSPADPS